MSSNCPSNCEKMVWDFEMPECAITPIVCARVSSLLIALVLMIGSACFVAAMPARPARQAPATNADSVEGLQSQIEAILNAAKKRDSKQYEDLIDSLKVPEGGNWFSATFGEEAGARVAANYGNSWTAYRDQISRIFQDTEKVRPKRIFIKQFSAASLPAQDGFLQAVMKNVKDSSAFYTVGAGKDREIATLPGIYVYVQGAFRILSWGAFYGLPGVKAMRIRLGTSVAMSQLLYQVNPTMNEDARKQDVQGTVVLHIVIDPDGNVSQVQPVSGPALLVQDALDAVRQWRFRPTLLNGDPVEVDTTVNITFSLNR